LILWSTHRNGSSNQPPGWSRRSDSSMHVFHRRGGFSTRIFRVQHLLLHNETEGQSFNSCTTLIHSSPEKGKEIVPIRNWGWREASHHDDPIHSWSFSIVFRAVVMVASLCDAIPDKPESLGLYLNIWTEIVLDKSNSKRLTKMAP
jgi:hypothetical protein